MKPSDKSTVYRRKTRIAKAVVFGLKTAFLCVALMFIIILIREGAFSYYANQNFDIRSSVLISLGFATSARIIKGRRRLHSSEVV
jgi:hypothetical protein